MERLKDVCRRTKRKLTEKDGAGVIHAVTVFLVVMIIFSVIYEYFRIQITANNIKDSFERAILTVASENYNEIYSGARQYDYIGGEYEGGPLSRSNLTDTPEWEELNDTGNVAEELEELLSLEKEDNILISKEDAYSLSDITVQVRYAGDAVSGKYEIKGTIQMIIPIYFSQVQVLEVNLPIRVTTAYTPKY